ncbi:MAG: carboxylate-amine ligase [Acidimicrobiia bacterium]|nr:carboxylate-amine ligase [Acidimicrobiia bacterium]
MTERPVFTIGIEEEYLIVDIETRELVQDLPDGLMAACEEILEGQVSPEFLRSQIEIGTKVCTSVHEVRDELKYLRRTVADVCNEYGLAPIAASTHPSADWYQQRHTDKPRYNILAKALGGVIRRLLICGMHVHVGIEDPDTRIDLMNQVLYFIPHMLALSTSSPFWNGDETGLKSYRTSVWQAVPRTGMPDEFDSWAEFERHVDVLVGAGVIEDATKLWWDLRPSARYPTLELRSSDICTNIDDTMAVAAMYVSLLSMLFRRRVKNQRWRIYSRMLIEENVWRAQRYGISGELIDFGLGEPVPYPDLLEEIIDLVKKDAKMLDCVDELHHARTIVERGTSADTQLKIYHDALEAGAGRDEALEQVVDWLIEETVRGV